MSLLQAIASEIAAREGVAPEELNPPLYEVIDLDALDALVTSIRSRQDTPDPVVEFEYIGYTITIDQARDVSIQEHTSTPGESSSENVDTMLEDSSAKLDHRERALQYAAATIAAHDRPFRYRLEGLLEVVRNALGMESATLSYIDNDSYVFEAVDVAATVELQAGEIVPLADTVCERAVETEQALVLRDVEQEAPELANAGTDVAAYIGVPVFVDNEVYGTFCFYDSKPRAEEFSEWELALIELLASLVSSELEQRQRERALQAATLERPVRTT